MTHEFEHSMGEPTQTGWPALAHVADAGYVHSLGAHMTCTAQRAPPDPRGRKRAGAAQFQHGRPPGLHEPGTPHVCKVTQQQRCRRSENKGDNT